MLICKHHKCFLHWFLEHVRAISSLTLSVTNAVVPTYVILPHNDIPHLVARHDKFFTQHLFLVEKLWCCAAFRKPFLAGLLIQEKPCWKTHYPSAAFFAWEMTSIGWSLGSLTSRISHNDVQRSRWPKKQRKGGGNIPGGAGKERETSLLFLKQKQEKKKRPAEKAVQGNSSLMQSGKQRIALQQSHHLSSV